MVSDYTARQRQLQLQMGKIQGAMTAIGDGQVLQERIDTLHRRIEALEETCAALETAQQTLSMATEQLQRRFAPRITERARELFAALTDGRYDRLNLTRELDWQEKPDALSCMRAAMDKCHDLPICVRRPLTQLGQTLGRFDLEGQLKGLKGVQEACRRELGKLENNRDVRLRSYQTLGLCAGAALVILFA